uniref:Uncharacterized protein n=1 Tax=viral metagenome TaxID=1070528 RepID=A0A6C0KI24_9ZZZZ
MEELGQKIGGNKTFLSHVFSTTEESKAEILNVVQYASMGVIPIVLLNKLIQRFIPEADPESSTLEIVVEIFLQLIVMFCGIIVIHRAITFFPTYSGFKYETLTLTNVVLAFLIIVLSIQTKMGIKVNILVDRALELWNGSSYEDKRGARRNVRTSSPVSQHAHSQADYLDNSQVQSGTFPPAPVATTKQNSLMETYDNMLGGGAHRGMPAQSDYMGPMAANSLLGGSFGSF